MFKAYQLSNTHYVPSSSTKHAVPIMKPTVTSLPI